MRDQARLVPQDWQKRSLSASVPSQPGFAQGTALVA
jgi:hypothetical protein